MSSGHIWGAVDVNSQNGQTEESEHDLPSLYNYTEVHIFKHFPILFIIIIVSVCVCLCVPVCVNTSRFFPVCA